MNAHVTPPGGHGLDRAELVDAPVLEVQDRLETIARLAEAIIMLCADERQIAAVAGRILALADPQ